MFNEISKKIKELLSVSTVYGVPNLMKSKRLFNKIFWILFMLAMSAASYYFINKEVISYLNFDVVTVVTREYEQPSPFPTVTFCSRGSLKFSNNLSHLILNKSRFGYNSEISKDPNNHFEAFMSDDYGICYRFNSGKNLSNHSIPIKNSTIGGRDDCFYLNINPKYSLIVWIHNSSTPPRIQFRNNHDHAFLISNETRFFIAIARTFDKKLAEPYNHCVKDEKTFEGNKTIIDFILSTNETYSQIKCLQLCFDLNYIEKNPCNCTNTSLDRVWSDCFKQRERKNTSGCTYVYKAAFYEKTLTEKCSQYCPLECDSMHYELSSYIYPDKSRSGIGVYVSYINLKYTLITQQPKKEIIELISAVGGILGLLIGVSFVSLFEITEIFIEIIIILIKHRTRVIPLSKK